MTGSKNFVNICIRIQISWHEARVSSSRELCGQGDYKAFILGMLAAFPDLVYSVDHTCWLGNERVRQPGSGTLVLHGTQTGPGYHGPLSGKRIWPLGFSHY